MRHLTRRLDRLETHRDLSATHAAVILVEPSAADLRQGTDLCEVAFAQGLLPPAVLDGTRMVLLLPTKVTNLDVWLAKGRSLEEWNAHRPRCGEHAVTLWEKTCPECGPCSPGAQVPISQQGGSHAQI
jgi:hypothetical protein